MNLLGKKAAVVSWWVGKCDETGIFSAHAISSIQYVLKKHRKASKSWLLVAGLGLHDSQCLFCQPCTYTRALLDLNKFRRRQHCVLCEWRERNVNPKLGWSRKWQFNPQRFLLKLRREEMIVVLFLCLLFRQLNSTLILSVRWWHQLLSPERSTGIRGIWARALLELRWGNIFTIETICVKEQHLPPCWISLTALLFIVASFVSV